MFIHKVGKKKNQKRLREEKEPNETVRVVKKEKQENIIKKNIADKYIY